MSEVLTVVGPESHGHRGRKEEKNIWRPEFISFLRLVAAEELCARHRSEPFTHTIYSLDLPSKWSEEAVRVSLSISQVRTRTQRVNVIQLLSEGKRLDLKPRELGWGLQALSTERCFVLCGHVALVLR